MKLKVLGLVSFLVMLGYGQNLLQNPGLESWTANMPDHWLQDDSIEVFQEDVIVHGGNFSAKDSLFTQTQATADFYQTVPVPPNTQCSLSVWVYDNDPPGRIGIGIYWFPAGSYWPNTFSVDSPQWQMLTLVTTSPSDAESASVMLRAYDVAVNWTGHAIFYLDDVYFGATSLQSPVIVRSWHTPTNPAQGATAYIYAYVVDDGTINHDTLFYGINSLQSPIALQHVSSVNDTFLYHIPGQTAGDTIFYYSKFVDNDGLTTVSDTSAYYVGTINLKINEVYYDAPGTDSLCFIEIFGPGSFSLDGFALVGVNGNGGVVYGTIDLTGYTIPPSGFFVVADHPNVPNVNLVDPLANLQNGPDNLELRLGGITTDAVGYGTLNGWVFAGEWLPAVVVEPGHSLGRYPDGNDTDNNSVDFHDYEVPTPGTANPPVGIRENSVMPYPIALPKGANPVRSGVILNSVICDRRYYPLTVYNAVGQAVLQIDEPDHRAALTAGVYFIRLSHTNDQCVKLVVVN
ncbi:hypothetical protein IBX73_10505 [candidate division WOR-3 bacterium]|nr:hypothetical protein [candidate division WOR-3 bacterium]